MWQPGKRKKHKIMKSSFKQIRIEKYVTPFASCYYQYNAGIFDPSRRYTPQEVCTKPHIMSFIFRHVPAVLATTVGKSVISMLEIPVTDEIHMQDRNHGLA